VAVFVSVASAHSQDCIGLYSETTGLQCVRFVMTQFQMGPKASFQPVPRLKKRLVHRFSLGSRFGTSNAV
jgi:hypothetical protein